MYIVSHAKSQNRFLESQKDMTDFEEVLVFFAGIQREPPRNISPLHPAELFMSCLGNSQNA